jgi:hypothetical protein
MDLTSMPDPIMAAMETPRAMNPDLDKNNYLINFL